MDARNFYGMQVNEISDTDDEMDSSSESCSNESELELVPTGSSSNSSNEEELAEDLSENEDEALQEETNGESAPDTWIAVSATSRQYPFTGKEELRRKPRPTGPENTVTPFDTYNLFVTEEIISEIVTETNKYADQVLQNTKITRRSRLKCWTPTNAHEIKKFLGLIIAMGLVRKPKLELYWSKKTIYDYPFICNNMSRDRFSLLLRFVHFNDNACSDNSKRLHKIEPLVQKLTDNYKSTYTPGSRLVVDESIIPFRGRVKFRQYIPGKAHKYGVKLYKLCSADAYTWNFHIYTGNMERAATFNHSESVVLQLCQPLLGQGSTIFADNFYTSVPLAEKLLKEKSYYCGTLRKNRKFVPKSLLNAKVKTGEMILQQNAGIKVYH